MNIKFLLVKNLLKKIQLFVLDALFPVYCLGCKKSGVWLCENCSRNIFLENEHRCGVCEKVFTPDGRTCITCAKKSPLAGLIAATSYADPLIAQAVHLYKYRFVQDLHLSLGEILVQAMRKTDLPLPDLVMPIPLHPRRLRWRGFNQAALLADHLCKNLLPQTELTLDMNSFCRTRYTRPQMQIKDYANRKLNAAGAFAVTSPKNIQNKTILLIDDIATTGSTIFECARVLKAAGAKEVFAAVIARQEAKKS